ncbi:hypothetical protein [uncultured Methanobrevibacter sp.]|uniref:hypothetical protein n=1 Tax=uncultured Methanobrevibacter sp. TaxID=253161 RepID=UPI0025CFC4B2|nr:hypothetical protein [uncultured Methanobrevibacter sp.]
MKDTNNLLEYNVWSAGEYKNNLEDIGYIPTTTQTVKTTKEYSIIGENSIHIKTIADNIGNFIIVNKQCDINTILTGKVHVRCTSGNASLRFVNNTSGEVISSTNISSGTLGEIIVSGTNTSLGDCRLIIRTTSKDTVLYCDNFILNLS